MTATRFGAIRRIGATLGLALFVSVAAVSSSSAYSARAQQMCTGDAMRLCSSEIPNISRIIACMRRNKANVSPGCRAVMEQEDPASRPKPVQVAPVASKPVVAARAEQPAPVRPKAVQPVAVEPKPAAEPPVAEPAVAERKPAPAVNFEEETIAAAVGEQPQRPRVNPFRRYAAEPKPVASSPVVPPAAPETRPAQVVPVEQKPALPPGAPPAPIQSKPFQTAAIAQGPVALASADVKPAEAKPAPAARPAKVVRHKQKPRQVAAARSYEGGGYERYVGMALPIMSLIMSQW